MIGRLIVVSLFIRLTTLQLASSKITTVDAFTAIALLRPFKLWVWFFLYWYAPWVFFWGRQCAFVFPIYVRKYRKYTIDRWIMVYTVCASAVISPLRQWLDSYAKTRLKMWHTFKHFIHMQYFLLLTNLVAVFVLWVSTGVLYEPRKSSLFWDYIPESELCFCLNLCRQGIHLLTIISWDLRIDEKPYSSNNVGCNYWYMPTFSGDLETPPLKVGIDQ